MKINNPVLSLFFWLLLAVLSVSCSSEEYPVGPPSEPGKGTSLTFTIGGSAKPAVSYAVASPNENVVDTLVIYMFGDGTADNSPNFLAKVYRIGRAGLSQSGASLTATIDITGLSGKHIFYFVANGKGTTSTLLNINVGTTTEDEFAERLSDVQDELLGLPLLMTARKEIANIGFPTEAEKKVTLTRRVARFDVDNNASVTNFRIEKILVEDVNLQTYIFSDATGTPAQSLSTGNLPIIQYGSLPDANGATPAEGLFYLYPTEIGQGKGGIWFEGVFMGERRIYKLKNEVSINPNKRYTLKVKKVDAETTDFEIVVDDWVNDGGNHIVEPETDNVVFSDIKMEGGRGLLSSNNRYDITQMSETLTLSFSVTSYNLPGTRAVVMGDTTDLPGFQVNAQDPVLTYSMYYVQKYDIIIPPSANSEAVIDIKIEVVNQLKTEQRLVLSIYTNVSYYPGTTLPPVVFDGITWAPVNVGATEIGVTNTVTHMGYLFQWGRNTPFVYGGDTANPTDIYPAIGPVYESVADKGAAAGKFIKGSSLTYYDWLTPPDNDLWKDDNRQGPCPDGWRVPTGPEFLSIAQANKGYSTDGKVFRDAATGSVVVQGDNDIDYLFFPAAGARYYLSGVSVYYSTGGYYWTSEPYNAHAVRFSFTDSGIESNTNPRTYAYSVRCVKD